MNSTRSVTAMRRRYGLVQSSLPIGDLKASLRPPYEPMEWPESSRTKPSLMLSDFIEYFIQTWRPRCIILDPFGLVVTRIAPQQGVSCKVKVHRSKLHGA